MKCSELMKRDLAVRQNDSIRVVAELMAARNLDFLPVLNHEREVVGVVTDRDLVVRGLAHGLDAFHTEVDEVSTHQVLTCAADEELSAAEQKMREAKASRIVVVDSSQVYQGVLSLRDVEQAGKVASA